MNTMEWRKAGLTMNKTKGQSEMSRDEVGQRETGGAREEELPKQIRRGDPIEIRSQL